MSDILSNQIETYQKTHYRVFCPGKPFVLQIGIHSKEIELLFRESRQNCALFITAFNPYGSIQSYEANLAAHQRRGDHLRALTKFVWEGEGANLSHQWPDERSYLAVGITHYMAQMLGYRAHQDAIVWIGPEAIPELILLR